MRSWKIKRIKGTESTQSKGDLLVVILRELGVEIIFYQQTFIGMSMEKCGDGGGGGGKRRRRQRQQSMESMNQCYFISTTSTIYPTLVLIV
jgi:hypothetical protein